MEEVGKNIHWYVMKVMSGHEMRVFKKMCLDCSLDSANIAEPLDIESFSGNFNGLFNGIYSLHIPYVSNIVKVDPKATKGGVAKDGKKTKEVKRKLYPGYVLLRAQLYNDEGCLLAENLNYVQNTKSVIGLLGGKYPQQLTDHEAEQMMHLQESEGAEVKSVIPYKVGESVSIKEGSFLGCEGVIESIDPVRQKLTLSVVIFGRHTPVEMDCGQVERL